MRNLHTARRTALALALLAAPATAQMPRPPPALRAPAAVPQYVLRMHAFRVRNDDGSQATAITPQQVTQWVNKVNQVMTASNAGIQLQFDPNPAGPDWGTLDNTLINHHGLGNAPATTAGNAIAAQYPGKLVVFFRKDTGGSDPNAGNGWSQGPDTGVNFIAMPGFAATSVTGDDTPGVADGERSLQNIWQLAHDFGHYLGLQHTFPTTGGDATGSLALARQYIRDHGGVHSALDGDGIADTPSEAGAAFFDSQKWLHCTGHDPYTISGMTANGLPFSYTYRPARNNIMSYFACEPMTFTPGQVQRMRSALLHPNRRLLVEAPCPADVFGLAAAAFQTCFDYWTKRGLWPVTVAANRIGSQTYFAASFQPGKDRAVRTMMTPAGFQSNFNTQMAAGARPDRVQALATTSGPRFNVVWTPVDGPFESRDGLTHAQFVEKWSQMHAAGFVNVDVTGYDTPQGTRYAGVWVKRPTQGDATYINMTGAEYQQRFNQLWAGGLRPTRISVYNVGAETRYAGTWEKLPGFWVARFGLTGAQFQAEYNARAAEGYRIHQITPLGDRYAVIWTR